MIKTVCNTPSQKASSGFAGVHQVGSGKHMAYIRVNGDQVYLGYFDNAAEAAAARAAGDKMKKYLLG